HKPLLSSSMPRPAGQLSALRPVCMPMEADELESCRALLSVPAGASADEIERAFMQRNFALIRGRSGAADEPLPPELVEQKQQLRAAYEKLVAHAREQAQAELAKRKR